MANHTLLKVYIGAVGRNHYINVSGVKIQKGNKDTRKTVHVLKILNFVTIHFSMHSSWDIVCMQWDHQTGLVNNITEVTVTCFCLKEIFEKNFDNENKIALLYNTHGYYYIY